MKNKKTNAMRNLDSNNIVYETIFYDENMEVNGVKIALENGIDPNIVFKTLLAQSYDKKYYVFQVPVVKDLDLKKAAQACGEKKLELTPLKDLLKVTGYERGGCTCLGMKKDFPTIIDESASSLTYYYISGGKKGIQIKVNPKEVIKLIDGKYADIT